LNRRADLTRHVASDPGGLPGGPGDLPPPTPGGSRRPPRRPRRRSASPPPPVRTSRPGPAPACSSTRRTVPAGKAPWSS